MTLRIFRCLTVHLKWPHLTLCGARIYSPSEPSRLFQGWLAKIKFRVKVMQAGQSFWMVYEIGCWWQDGPLYCAAARSLPGGRRCIRVFERERPSWRSAETCFIESFRRCTPCRVSRGLASLHRMPHRTRVSGANSKDYIVHEGDKDFTILPREE
jgi:hypothetical protein